MLMMKRTDARRKGKTEDRLTFALCFGVLTVNHFRGDKLIAQYAASNSDAKTLVGLCEQQLKCYPNE